MARLTEIVDQIEPAKQLTAKQLTAKQLITELVFMRRTLGRLRKQIDDGDLVEHFNQGKQQFDRESPALKSYTALVARFSTLHRQLCSLLPKNVALEPDEFDLWMQEIEEN